MERSSRKLAAVVLAVGLGLTGCGSSGDDGDVMTPGTSENAPDDNENGDDGGSSGENEPDENEADENEPDDTKPDEDDDGS